MTPLQRLPRAALRRAALASTALALTIAPAAAAADSSIDARERAVVDRVNAVRAHRGLAPLALDRRLSASAARHSQRMQARGVLAHRLPGEAPLASRLRWAVGGALVGEVVAWRARGARSAQLVRSWMDSPPHRAVLLSGRFRSAGVGIVSGRGGVYATVDVAAR